MALLEVKNLKKAYKLDAKNTQEVLKGVDFSLEAGELVAIVGESGSGKSTLLNIIGGLDTQYEGDIIFNNCPIRDYKNDKLDDFRKLNIGFIFQSFNLIPTLTVLENIKTSSEYTDIDTNSRDQKAKSLVDKLGLSGMENKLPSQLSGGQKQRVSIARALMNDPDMILADEPTGALDKENAESVTRLLKEIASEGTLVVVVTHSKRVASECDKVIALEYGVVAEITTNTDRESAIDKTKQKNIKPKKLSFFTSIKKAFCSVRKNKLRNALVSLGGGIGIFAVVIMLFLSSGMQSYITKQMYGSNNPLVIEVYKEQENSSNAPIINSGAPFLDEEIEELQKLDNINSLQLGLSLAQSSSYSYKDNNGKIMMLSTVYDGFAPTLKYGQMPNDNEILLSESIASALADDMSLLIGSSISVNITYDAMNNQIAHASMVISGIIESNTIIDSRLTSAYITTNTITKAFEEYGKPKYTSVYLTANNEDCVEQIKAEVKELGYSVNRQDATLDQISMTLDIITIGLTSISAISLVVSSIMIMVVLFISVVERTKEIGTLRAIGASKSDIRKSFVSEGLLLGLLGGLIGVIFAVVLGGLANIIMANLLGVSIIDINILYALFGIIVSTFVGILASLIPASKAANLDPVESLRHE